MGQASSSELSNKVDMVSVQVVPVKKFDLEQVTQTFRALVSSAVKLG